METKREGRETLAYVVALFGHGQRRFLGIHWY